MAFLTVAYLYGRAHPAATVIFHLLIPVSAVVASNLTLEYMQKKKKEKEMMLFVLHCFHVLCSGETNM